MKVKILCRNLTITIVWFIFSINLSNAQWAIMRADADSLVQLGVSQIYNVKFIEAEKSFGQVIKLYPDHPVGYFLDAMVDWWKITLYRDNKSFDKSFLNKIEKVINVTNNLLSKNDQDIVALFFKAGAIGYRGRFYAQNESWVSAAKDGSEAFELLKQCYRIAPSNHDIMLGTGIYNYFAAVFPDKYPIIKPLLLFLPSGDRALGILQLNAAARQARYASVEAKVVLLQIYYTFENDIYRALELSQELNERYPDNPYFHRYLARAYVRRGNTEMYEKTWRDILIRCIDKKPGYERYTAREAMYYIGLALFERGDFQQALRYFYKSDEGSRALDKPSPSGFMIMSNMYIAQIYDIQGKRKDALEQYNKILRMKEFDNSHTRARQLIESPYRR